MWRLLALSALAGAQDWGQLLGGSVRIEFRVDDSVLEASDLEAALRATRGPLSQPGLVLLEGAPPAAPSPMERLVSALAASAPMGFTPFPPPTQEYVIRQYADDDGAEETSTHDFGCPCGEDVAALCGEAAADDDFRSVYEKRLCLARQPALSPACAEHLAAYPTVVEACAPDIQAGCPDVAPGDNRIHACLAARPALAPTCGDYLRAVGPAAGLEDVAIVDAELREAEGMMADVAAMAREAFSVFGLFDQLMGAAAVQDDAPSDEWLAFDDKVQVAPPVPMQPAFARQAYPRLHQSEVEAPQAPPPLPRKYLSPADLADAMQTQQMVEPVEEETQVPDARAERLAALALALGALAGGLATVFGLAAIAAAMRRQREIDAMAEFRAKFSPMLREDNA